MSLLAIKAAGRMGFRRSPLQTRPANKMRGHHTKSQPTRKENDNPADGTSVPVPNTVANLPIWHRLGPLSIAFRTYGRSQRKHPLKTQFFSALVIFSLGDLSAQSINGDEYNPTRTLRALVIGAGAAIPSYKWFMFLGSHFNYSSKVLSLATKVTVNQALFTPINNSYFFGMQAFLSGDSMEQVWDRIKRTVPTSMINSLKLWPAVTAFSFTFVDAQYRSIFAGVIAIGWQTYLSYLNRKAEDEKALESASGSREKREMRSERAQKLGA